MKIGNDHQIKAALSCYANSPCQCHWKCIENSMENCILMLGCKGISSGGHPFPSPNGLLLSLHVYFEIHVDAVLSFLAISLLFKYLHDNNISLKKKKTDSRVPAISFLFKYLHNNNISLK